MSLLTEKTLWVLFLSCPHEPDERHVYDLAFGLYCLESAGISNDNIRLYIDCNDKNNVKNLIRNATDHDYEIQDTSELFTHLNVNAYNNIVMFITGHGSVQGLNARTPIKPAHLVNSLRKSPNLEKGIVYLGQCYAGIFNYMNVGEKRNDDDEIVEPPIILIGATNLFNSISATTNETLPNGSISWGANLFLLNVFRWIKNPFDVDGDNKNTIMDSYKFAGAMSNDNNKQIKSTEFITPFQHLQVINEIQMKMRSNPIKDPNHPSNALLDLDLKAAQKSYYEALDIRFNHQECWILNSIPAQKIEL